MADKNISVVIPAYNAEKTIGRCLGALGKQTLAPLEVIVIDDGSVDRTAEIAARFATVSFNTHKKGAAGARNTGADIAKADIIAFTDSDCIPSRNWLENISAVFTDESVGTVGGGYSSGIDDTFWQRFCCEELLFRRRNRGPEVMTLVSNNFACRKSLFLTAGGFPEEYPVCEDMLLSYKISQKAKVIWLKDNGVQHHFKDSLKAYLKHQYFFGVESTRFFLQNRRLLFVNSHQGRSLHGGIILALLSFLGISSAVFCIFLNNIYWERMLLSISALLLAAHSFLYLQFIRYLTKIRFPNIAKAYGVSFLRDLICGFSIFHGLGLAMKNNIGRRINQK